MGLAAVAACSAAAAAPDAVSAAGAQSAAARHGSWTFASDPAIHPATVKVTTDAAGAATGDIFVAPILAPGQKPPLFGQSGPLILDAHGQPIWQGTVPRGEVAMNFHPQVYAGAPVLTWWQGAVKALGYGAGQDVILNSAYQTIAVVRGAGGFQPDLHDFLITPQGTAFVTAYKTESRDLSRYRGARNGRLLDSVVQEIDIRTGRLIFQWDPLKHLSLSESYTVPPKGLVWDPFHANSIDLDGAGHLLISMRNTWGIYEVSRKTGAVIWRLGGKRTSFKLGRGVRFAYQHDARYGAGGTISLFDDGGAPAVEKQSRGLSLGLDMRHRAAHVLHQYTHPKHLLTGSQGNTQILPGGDAFVGWGGLPYFSEFSQSGRLLFDAHFHGPDESYRAFSQQWTGNPATAPSIAAKAAGGNTETVYASWNGATEVATWQVLSGAAQAALAPVANAARSGFETVVHVGGAGRYYVVRALDSSGRVLGTSATVHG